MLDEYVDVNPEFGERLLFLFCGLINKKYLISKTITTVSQPIQVVDNEEQIVEGAEFKVDIPFFDLGKDDTKSNL